nr:MAG TPA: hypothetical protein [Caudoviricetes sp.]
MWLRCGGGNPHIEIPRRYSAGVFLCPQGYRKTPAR